MGYINGDYTFSVGVVFVSVCNAYVNTKVDVYVYIYSGDIYIC